MRRNIILLIGIFVLIISIAGCQKDTQLDDNKPVPTNIPNATQIETQKPIDSNQNIVTPKENKSTPAVTKDAKDVVDTDKKKAIDLVVKKFNLTYNKDTEDYSQKGETYNVILTAHGFDDKGRYEIRICPSEYPLSVYTYCYVDLKSGTITTEP